MKSIYRVLVAAIGVGIGSMGAASSTAQAVAPQKSAAATAVSETQWIAAGIADNRDALLLSQKAAGRSANERLRELAQQMAEDHTAMLYTLQELSSAGGSGQPVNGSANQPASDLKNKLSTVSGADFDTLWVSGMLGLQQARYDQLVQAKGSMANPQLNMAITEAIPLMRKHCSQLKVLQKELAREAVQQKKEAASRH